MRRYRWFASVLTCLTLLAPAATVRAEPPAGDIRDIPEPAPEVRSTCFEQGLALGPIIIPGSRCYNFYLLRTDAGGFLGFGPPGPPMIAPGQSVLLNSPAGAQVRNRLMYLIPLPVALTAIPMNSMRSIAVQISGGAGRVVVSIQGASERPIELAFSQR